jgi:hypothetical protein
MAQTTIVAEIANAATNRIFRLLIQNRSQTYSLEWNFDSEEAVALLSLPSSLFNK